MLPFYNQRLFVRCTLLVIALLLLPMVQSLDDDFTDENRDYIALDPVQLIDLVLEDEAKQRNDNTKGAKQDIELSRKMRHSHELFASEQNSVANYSQASIATPRDRSEGDMNDLDKKGDPLKLRKVWSRWSKWGECSSSCGEGVIARRRVCVAGRCAPGEAEEQRRPCVRATCTTQDLQESTTMRVDELRDLE